MHARRYGGLVGLVLYDLDRFKDINDTLGHEVGDRVLRHVAAQIEASMRPSDTLARLGGDEFVLLMPGLRTPMRPSGSPEGAAALEQPLQLDGSC